MRKLYIVGLVAVAALVIGIAIADEIKFSTYYPAPFGQYREFSTTGKTTLATNEFGIETDARVGIGTTNPGTAKLAVIGGNVGIGTTSPQNKLDVEGTVAVGATYSGTSLAPSNGMIIEGNVGIGTTSPDGKLDVVSTNSGFIFPRFDTHNDIVNNITTPVEGMSVYNLEDHVMEYYNGSEWIALGGREFGVWNDRDKDGLADTCSKDQIYTAQTDGFVIAYTVGQNEPIQGYTPASTLRQHDCSWMQIPGATIFMPVRSGDTWRVIWATEVFWLPLGN